VRLLLDETYGSVLADLLRERDHDVHALTDHRQLRSLPDDAVLRLATSEARALATEDVGDFARLHGRFLAEGKLHAGIILVSARRFSRRRGDVGRLATALDNFLSSPPSSLPKSFLWWLS
jgi:hypothetical protein